MSMIRDVAKFTIKELKLNKVEPITKTEWSIIDQYLLDKVSK